METQEWNPGLLLELSGYYWKTCTLHAGVKLDLFTLIGDEHLTADDIAARLNCDKRALIMLLNALTAMDLLTKSGDTFSNTTAAGTFLSKASPQHIGYMIMHHHHLVDSWSQLDLAIKTGEPVRSRASHSEEWREAFLMGMFNNAMKIAPQVADAIDLSGRRRLLDLGGGPGTYAIHFCMKNPELSATIADLPTTRPFAQKTVDRFELADRIDFRDIDYLEENVEGVYDVAWLSHILHGEGPEDCQMIVKKAVFALDQGGTILVHDFILDNSMDGPLFPALFSLNMLLGTSSGQSYSEEQIVDMLATAGVKNIRRIPIDTPNDSGILAGEI
ncbi:MAG: SAM-dependent methyltransferase [Deltaproteobacteria bacterium]|nr:SAM-dependent methyltransferase [Deltaproteobacteria bacterium]